MSLFVSDAMVQKIVSIEEGFSVKEAAKLMNLRGVSSLIITSRGHLAGIVTENDMVSRVLARGASYSRLRVGEIMSQPVMTIKPGVQLDEAVRLMLMQGIKKLPVVGETGSLVGMLSLTDVAVSFPALYSIAKKASEKQERCTRAYIS